MTNTLHSVPVDPEDRMWNMTTVTPSSSGHAISKSAITNASFRTKKLPGMTLYDLEICQVKVYNMNTWWNTTFKLALRWLTDGLKTAFKPPFNQI